MFLLNFSSSAFTFICKEEAEEKAPKGKVLFESPKHRLKSPFVLRVETKPRTFSSRRDILASDVEYTFGPGRCHIDIASFSFAEVKLYLMQNCRVLPNELQLKRIARCHYCIRSRHPARLLQNQFWENCSDINIKFIHILIWLGKNETKFIKRSIFWGNWNGLHKVLRALPDPGMQHFCQAAAAPKSNATRKISQIQQYSKLIHIEDRIMIYWRPWSYWSHIVSPWFGGHPIFSEALI